MDNRLKGKSGICNKQFKIRTKTCARTLNFNYGTISKGDPLGRCNRMIIGEVGRLTSHMFIGTRIDDQ